MVAANGEGELEMKADLPEGLLGHPDGDVRCWWCGTDPLYIDYHDHEWAVPTHDDRGLFEKLCLEGFQAGLSWLTILRKRAALREVFAGFDPGVVASFDESDVRRLLDDARIVRNRSKIEAVVINARTYLELVASEGTLDALVWSFAPTWRPAPSSPADIPTQTGASRALAAELKRRGFRFVGPTTTYAFMQAMGLVDDHLVGCAFRGDRGV